MSKGKIALLALSLFSSSILANTKIIDEMNKQHLIDVVPSGSYIGDFTNQKEVLDEKVHTGIDIFPTNTNGNNNYQFIIQVDNNGNYKAPEDMILSDVTSAYDGYVVAHKSYDSISKLNTSMYGDFYLIKHPEIGVNQTDLYTLYLHMAHPSMVADSRDTPEIGDYVSKGDLLGIIYKGGTSSNGYYHLHYAIQTFSNLAERSWLGFIYPSALKAIGDYIVHINGLETTNNAFYDSVYMDPETFIFPETIDYQLTEGFSLSKTLRNMTYISSIINTLDCNNLLNAASNEVSITGNDKFEFNFSSLYISTVDERNSQANSCLFKDVEHDIIVRYQVDNKNIFIYDKNIDAGQNTVGNPDYPSSNQYSTDQFMGLYDTAYEVYNYWNDKIGDKSAILENAVNLVNSSLLTYTSGDVNNCMIDWNSLETGANVSNQLDLNLHVFKYGKECVIYDRFHAAYLLYNSNFEIYKYGTNVGAYKLMKMFAVNEAILLKEIIQDVSLLNGLNMEVTNTAQCMILWSQGGSVRNVHTDSKTYEAKFYGDRCLYFRGNSYVIDFDLETRQAEYIYYTADNSNKYQEYMTFRHFVNNMKSAKADETWRNGYGLTLNSSGNIGCTVADNCVNGEITTIQQCENVFVALTGIFPSVMNATTSLSLDNICHFANNDSGKIVEYDSNTGRVDIIIPPTVKTIDKVDFTNITDEDYSIIADYMQNNIDKLGEIYCNYSNIQTVQDILLGEYSSKVVINGDYEGSCLYTFTDDVKMAIAYEPIKSEVFSFYHDTGYANIDSHAVYQYLSGISHEAQNNLDGAICPIMHNILGVDYFNDLLLPSGSHLYHSTYDLRYAVTCNPTNGDLDLVLKNDYLSEIGALKVSSINTKSNIKSRKYIPNFYINKSLSDKDINNGNTGLVKKSNH